MRRRRPRDCMARILTLASQSKLTSAHPLARSLSSLPSARGLDESFSAARFGIFLAEIRAMTFAGLRHSHAIPLNRKRNSAVNNIIIRSRERSAKIG